MASILGSSNAVRGVLKPRAALHDAYATTNLQSVVTVDARPRWRRPCSYSPTVWDDGYLQSLRSDCVKEGWMRERMGKLQEEVRGLLEDEKMGLVKRLELVDLLQGLGVGRRYFEKEIDGVLSCAAAGTDPGSEAPQGDLSSMALLFRLLRQKGHMISQDVFDRFRVGTSGSGFDVRVGLGGDIRGALSLYEAALRGRRGEDKLDAARAVAVEFLVKFEPGADVDDAQLVEEVARALELPPFRRIGRLHARWLLEMITSPGRRPDASVHPAVQELAALDFNMVQSLHRDELKEMSRWWKDLGLKERMSFARDRITESFFCSIGIVPDPEFSRCREKLTQVCSLITTIDDIYDEYGAYHELQLFTVAVERWEFIAADELPSCMQACYEALLHTVGHMCQELREEKGLDALPFFKKAWAELCRAFLVEATWIHDRHMPKFDEYMNYATMSIGSHVTFAHAVLFLDVDMADEDLAKLLRDYPPIVRYAATISRLLNDLVEREGLDTPSSIACFLNENKQLDAGEEAARRHMKGLIDEAWRCINQEMAASPLPAAFTTAAANIARLSHCLYQHGDGYREPGKAIQQIMRSLLMEPLTSAKMTAADPPGQPSTDEVILPN